MKHGSLFSGIGGFDLAAEWMGWTNVFHCEYNPFGQRVLKHYWPNAISYGDIKQTDFTIHRGEIDIISGGFPCQPFSSAGKRKGTEDDRHLWPEMLRAIREIQPSFIVGENVRGFTNWNGGMVFDQVQADLEAEGYEVLPFLLPACAVNAPHRRDRIWIVAHKNTDQDGRGSVKREEEPKERGLWDVGTGDNERVRADNEDIGTTAHPRSQRHNVTAMGENNNQERENGKEEQGNRNRVRAKISGCCGTTPNTERIGQQGQRGAKQPGNSEAFRNWKASWSYDDGRWPTQPPVCGRNDGLSTELDGITVSRHRKESIMAYGNAIVPQVAFEIFKVINALSKNPQ